MKTLLSASCYTYSCFTPFHMADPAGILFFGHVLQLAHQAFEQFIIMKMGCSWKDWFENEMWIVPIKHTETDYLAPIKAGEDCIIELTIKDISQTSFSISYRFIQSKLCCEASTVHVFCERATRKKIPIPENILAALYKLKT